MHEKVKVVFPLDEGPAETMWASARDDGLFELASIPWFAYGVSLGDVFSTRLVEGDSRPYFDKVVIPSGKTTYRLTFDEHLSKENRRAAELVAKRLGDLAEAHSQYGDGYTALVASTDEQRHEMELLLDQGEDARYWDWETSTAPE